MKRVFYHYRECEEFEAGLWRIVPPSEREELIDKAAALLADPSAFRAVLARVVKEWPRSCEVNMTAVNGNRQAWMGWAGCLLATGSPEDLTRVAWHMLTLEQQAAANAVADEAIEAWEEGYRLAGLEDGQLGLIGLSEILASA